MTTCNLNNFCWLPDGKEICPCQAILPLALIILGITIVLVALTLIISKLYNKSKKND